MQTMLLTQDDWDVCLNAAGDWAVASDPYSIAQDCASAIKTFLGEVYYNTLEGINYFGLVLGKNPPLQLLKSQIIGACLTVPQVTAAVVFISSTEGRTVSGQVLISFTTTATASAPVGTGQALIFFVGDNGGVITFVGDNGGVIEFVGIL